MTSRYKSRNEWHIHGKTDETKKSSLLLGPLIVIILAQVGTSSDNSALGIAVQELTKALGATVADVQMANLAYSLTAGSCMIAGGMVGVVIGWQKTLRIGLVLAIIGEAVVVAATSMDMFTWGGRFVIGLGASFITPSVLGLIPALYEGQARAAAFGFVAAASAASALIPIPIGLLLDTAGFRVTFGVIALYFLIVFLCTRLLPNLPKPSAQKSIDGIGIVLAASGLALLLLGIARVSTWGFIIPLPDCPFTIFDMAPTSPAIIAGTTILVALVAFERRRETCGKATLLPHVFIGTPEVRAGLLAVAVPFFCLGAQGILMTPYLQLVAGFTALQTGLLSLLSGVPMLLCAILVPKLLKTALPRLVIRIGYGLVIGGVCATALSLEQYGVTPLLFVGTSLVGGGIGIVNSQANNAVASVVDPASAQQSGGIQGTARNIGMAMGTALMGSLLLMAVSIGTTAHLGALESTMSEPVAAIERQGVSFSDDASYEALATAAGVPDDSSAAIVDSLALARRDATRASMLILAGIVALALIGTRNIVKRL